MTFTKVKIGTNSFDGFEFGNEICVLGIRTVPLTEQMWGASVRTSDFYSQSSPETLAQHSIRLPCVSQEGRTSMTWLKAQFRLPIRFFAMVVDDAEPVHKAEHKAECLQPHLRISGARRFRASPEFINENPQLCQNSPISRAT